MDFSFDEGQEAVRALARQILEDQATPDRLREVETGHDRFDAKLWQALADAGLVGIALPDDVGGGGLGFLEVCLLLEQVGRTVAPVPAWPVLVLGALPLAQFGTPEQRARELPGVARGERLLTGALTEVGADPRRPVTTAAPDGDGWRLTGVKVCVPAAHLAQRVVVPASVDGGGAGLFLVDMTADGLVAGRQETPSGHPEFRLTLDGVRVGPDDVVGGPAALGEAGAAMVEWLVDRAIVGLCAVGAGLCQQAVRLTADYTKTRHQFDKPIASFQAVGQRAADAYIDTEAVTLTMWQAAWRLAEGLPAAREVEVAKFWAADGGQRVVHAAQHLHGGIGVDRDYPLHRYFLWAKQVELALGGATPHLVRLGGMLAAEPA